MVHNLREHYHVANTTIYGIKKQCKKLLKFYAESDSDKGIAKCRTVLGFRSADLAKLVYGCFKQCCNEGICISMPLLYKKAKQFHQKLKSVSLLSIQLDFFFIYI